MSKERDELLARRQKVKDQFGDLFSEVEQILFKHDPMGIAFSDSDSVADNADEYALEVETILPRLDFGQDVSDVRKIVYEEFHKWFGDAGEEAKYQQISVDIWQAWQRFKPN